MPTKSSPRNYAGENPHLWPNLNLKYASRSMCHHLLVVSHETKHCSCGLVMYSFLCYHVWNDTTVCPSKVLLDTPGS